MTLKSRSERRSLAGTCTVTTASGSAELGRGDLLLVTDGEAHHVTTAPSPRHGAFELDPCRGTFRFDSVGALLLRLLPLSLHLTLDAAGPSGRSRARRSWPSSPRTGCSKRPTRGDRSSTPTTRSSTEPWRTARSNPCWTANSCPPGLRTRSARAPAPASTC
ncbi:hypothetical protein ACWEOE_31125 [Amycolatopsis sp. NPDC004368]